MQKALKISDNVTFETIDSKVYILDISNGEYYELSESASIIWKEIHQGNELDSIKENLTALFDNNKKINDDIDEVINNFLNLNLITDN